ncbi:hypothetical protein V490_00791 [Pseudogymnoascus sp. VKM F-3557]|nr:hypothetical protein V490_00791 [Pseudogymnoascus sp. VKM F-3557]
MGDISTGQETQVPTPQHLHGGCSKIPSQSLLYASGVTLSGWRWRQCGLTSNVEWNACMHSKPTTEIFTDLLDAKQIPDPFLDENEKLVQWVGESDWEYACDFTHNAANAHAFQDLVFDGLDTIASVYLNDELILESINMFHAHRVDVTGKLHDGLNSLRITFHSALKYGKDLQKRHGHYRSFNGDHSRMHVRKAQYHYGWDWGPVLMSCGPYREVRLESYAAQINNIFVDPQLSCDLQQANVSVSFDAAIDQDVEVDVCITSPSSVRYHSTAIVHKSETSGLLSLTIPNPELWYPIGHGAQVFYTVDIELKASSGTILQSTTKKIGMRRVRLVQNPLEDQPGSSFYFEVNNNPVYSCGANWIPGHSFLTSMTDAEYTAALTSLADSNQNMIRVWAGGIYEPDIFYEECDRLGILVWQDFMFACGRYPCYPEFAASVKKEAVDQILRLRNFCSIIVYAGNNEDYCIAENLKLDWDMDDNSGDWTSTNFPARTIYETYLPSIIAKYSPSVPYHPGSPWGGNGTEDPTVGDTHQWNVWHGSQEKYQLWDKLVSRFVSEFGMLGFPSVKTINKFVTDPKQRYPQSSVLDHHNKADGSERRLALYVMENLRVNAMDIESWVYATQLMQAECLSFAYRSCRREWRGPSREYCGGNLVWQLNDCWPTQSWSLIDFYGDRKLAYYAIKRVSANLSLGINRTTPELKALKGPPEKITDPPHDLSFKTYIFDIWAVNMTLDNFDAKIEVRLFDIITGALVEEKHLPLCSLAANRTTELAADLAVLQTTAIQARMLTPDGVVVGRASDWPQPLKYVMLPCASDMGITLTVMDGLVEIRSETPVKCLQLYLPDESRNDVIWEDNGVDVFPGDVYVIKALGLEEGDDVRMRFYGSS